MLKCTCAKFQRKTQLIRNSFRIPMLLYSLISLFSEKLISVFEIKKVEISFFNQLGLLANHGIRLLESFSKDNGEGNENVTNLHIYSEKTIAVSAFFILVHFFAVVYKTTT